MKLVLDICYIAKGFEHRSNHWLGLEPKVCYLSLVIRVCLLEVVVMLDSFHCFCVEVEIAFERFQVLLTQCRSSILLIVCKEICVIQFAGVVSVTEKDEEFFQLVFHSVDVHLSVHVNITA